MPMAMPLPKYHQVYLVLREQLAEGRFAGGLPGEMKLVEQFGVARVTVRRALEKLALEGLIDRAPGRGTHPRAPAAAPAAGGAQRAQRAQLSGLLENLVSMGLRTAVKVLSCEVLPAPADIAARLALPAGAPVQKAVRVRSTAAGPLSHITTHIPAELARGFGRRELARQPVLLLLEKNGVRIGRARQSIGARLADATVAPHLDVAVGSALLSVQRLILDENERPVQWLQGLYRPDRYQYEMQLSRVGDAQAKLWVSTELSAQFH